MNQEQQGPDGLQYDALIPGEMWRTTGKNGMSTGWALVANVDGDEVRRLRRIGETLHGDVGLLRHPAGITFAISRVEAGLKRYTFVLPLAGPEVLAMLEMLSVTGFRVAFHCGNQEVHRYAMPVTTDSARKFHKSHLRQYSKQSVLLAASNVAVNLLEDSVPMQPGTEHLVCVVATPELQTWASRRYGST